MAATSMKININVMDLPELDRFKRAYQKMATALARIDACVTIDDTPEISNAIDDAHITEVGLFCWCGPKIEHVVGEGEV